MFRGAAKRPLVKNHAFEHYRKHFFLWNATLGKLLIQIYINQWYNILFIFDTNNILYEKLQFKADFKMAINSISKMHISVYSVFKRFEIHWFYKLKIKYDKIGFPFIPKQWWFPSIWWCNQFHCIFKELWFILRQFCSNIKLFC